MNRLPVLTGLLIISALHAPLPAQDQPATPSPVVSDISDYFARIPGVKKLPDGSIRLSWTDSLVVTPTIHSPIPFDTAKISFTIKDSRDIDILQKVNFSIRLSVNNETWAPWSYLHRPDMVTTTCTYILPYNNAIEWDTPWNYFKLRMISKEKDIAKVIIQNPQVEFLPFTKLTGNPEHLGYRTTSIGVNDVDVLDYPGLVKSATGFRHESDSAVVIASKSFRAPMQFNWARIEYLIPTTDMEYCQNTKAFFRYSKDGTEWTEWRPGYVHLREWANEKPDYIKGEEIWIDDVGIKDPLSGHDSQLWNYLQFKIISGPELNHYKIINHPRIKFGRYEFQSLEEYNRQVRDHLGEQAILNFSAVEKPVEIDLSPYLMCTPGIEEMGRGKFRINAGDSLVTTRIIPTPSHYAKPEFVFELVEPDTMGINSDGIDFYFNLSPYIPFPSWTSWIKLDANNNTRGNEYHFELSQDFERSAIAQRLKLLFLPRGNRAPAFVIRNPRIILIDQEGRRFEGKTKVISILLDVNRDIADFPGLDKRELGFWCIGTQDIEIVSRPINPPFLFNAVKISYRIPGRVTNKIAYINRFNNEIRYSNDGKKWSPWKQLTFVSLTNKYETDIATLKDGENGNNTYWRYAQFDFSCKSNMPDNSDRLGLSRITVTFIAE